MEAEQELFDEYDDIPISAFEYDNDDWDEYLEHEWQTEEYYADIEAQQEDNAMYKHFGRLVL